MSENNSNNTNNNNNLATNSNNHKSGQRRSSGVGSIPSHRSFSSPSLPRASSSIHSPPVTTTGKENMHRSSMLQGHRYLTNKNTHTHLFLFFIFFVFFRNFAHFFFLFCDFARYNPCTYKIIYKNKCI